MRLLQIDFSFDSILSALNSECHELCSFLFALKSPIASSDNINYHLCLKIFCTFNQVMKNVVKTCVDYLLLVLSTSLDPNFDRDNPFATQLIFFSNYFVHWPSIHSSFQSLNMIQDGFTFLPALVSLLLDLGILSSILTSPLARLIAKDHGASTDLSLACPLNDCYVLALKISIMKSLQLLDQGVSSDVSNTIFLQLLDQGVCSALPSLRCRFMTVLNTDFKCSVNLS
eukprot:CAMPEP_0201231084 /NCGR_PEP_ID=MMETSP0852-20130820/2725_1 /ASSEMBLY_ACC=CAM_ASM_000632 /TAXON_ID=183588 /ORGANISM="Pseudo-nitzschia fraudulenta, Strain WWA7" /LENGTH=227 /DNA_ID=CAMNT_0047522531 /DNA_START=186 /DNA_END=865 /DNA_ORIENTATION=+